MACNPQLQSCYDHNINLKKVIKFVGSKKISNADLAQEFSGKKSGFSREHKGFVWAVVTHYSHVSSGPTQLQSGSRIRTNILGTWTSYLRTWRHSSLGFMTQGWCSTWTSDLVVFCTYSRNRNQAFDTFNGLPEYFHGFAKVIQSKIRLVVNDYTSPKLKVVTECVSCDNFIIIMIVNVIVLFRESSWWVNSHPTDLTDRIQLSIGEGAKAKWKALEFANHRRAKKSISCQYCLLDAINCRIYGAYF